MGPDISTFVHSNRHMLVADRSDCGINIFHLFQSCSNFRNHDTICWSFFNSSWHMLVADRSDCGINIFHLLQSCSNFRNHDTICWSFFNSSWYPMIPFILFIHPLLPAQRYVSMGICYSISVCLSHACFISKQPNILPKFFYHLIAPSF